MNLKLEELRKRLLEPVPTSNGSGTSVYKRSSAEIFVASQKTGEAVRNAASETAPASVMVESATHYEPLIAPPIGNDYVSAANTPNGVREAVLRYAEKATINSTIGEDAMDSNSQYQVAQAVAKVFEQVKVFEDRFAELTKTFEPVECLAQSAAKSFTPLRTFQEQLAQLSRSFEPMRTFQAQLAELAQSFEPMKGLQRQLALLSDAFEINIGQLVRSLDPAREFQLSLLKLARSFEPAIDLQSDFALLADTFRSARPELAINSNGIGNGNGVAPAIADAQH
ncbi:MAG: hypothetical protein IVW56_03685 [Candidatus Binataceae bacterium]|nr:hypothetical protein [Candidatus Binataceae bacterium]